MEEQKKKCYNCGNFGAYYTKGFCKFDKTDFGSCSKLRETKERHGSCEFWRKRYEFSYRRDVMAKKILIEILYNLAAVKQILEEEQKSDE